MFFRNSYHIYNLYHSWEFSFSVDSTKKETQALHAMCSPLCCRLSAWKLRHSVD